MNPFAVKAFEAIKKDGGEPQREIKLKSGDNIIPLRTTAPFWLVVANIFQLHHSHFDLQKPEVENND